LSGTFISHNTLSFRTLAAKVLGVIFSNGSGMAVGKLGPFVHIAGCLADQLFTLTVRLVKFLAPSSLAAAYLGSGSPALKRQIIAAGAAAGVTAVLGAPIGGVLFSIEVTAMYYMVSNLWRAFFCSVMCLLTYQYIHALKKDELFKRTEFDEEFKVWIGRDRRAGTI
jgi:chloride channel 2